MATIAATLPRARPKRPRNQPAAGRACFPEVYFVKRIDNSRLRREVNPARRRECLCVLGLGVWVFLFGFVFAWQHFKGVERGYEIEQLKAQRAGIEEWNHQLRLEQASLSDPQRIDILAKKELGLSPPGPRQVVPVSNDTAGPAQEDSPEFARNFSSASGDTSREQ